MIDMVSVVVSVFSVAAGIMLGTFLMWIVSYFILKRYAGKFIGIVKENLEVKKILKEIRAGWSILEEPEVKELIKLARDYIRRQK